jgi:hypothetical protein
MLPHSYLNKIPASTPAPPSEYTALQPRRPARPKRFSSLRTLHDQRAFILVARPQQYDVQLRWLRSHSKQPNKSPDGRSVKTFLHRGLRGMGKGRHEPISGYQSAVE